MVELLQEGTKIVPITNHIKQIMNSTQHYNTLIIGAGISGLNSARLLTNIWDHDFHIIEAKLEAWGRIHWESLWNWNYNDLWPSWFWPSQTRILKLLEYYKLEYFPQYELGDVLLQNDTWWVNQYPASAMMMWWYRIYGGYKKLIEKMFSEIPESHFSYNSPVKKISYSDGIYSVSVGDSKKTYTCNTLVLAIPPRIIASHIDISHVLSQTQIEVLSNIPTWMAGSIKVIVQYKKAFWREQWLSGNGVSYIWPLMQFHDTSPKDNSHGSLFWFVRKNTPNGESLKENIISQLQKILWKKAKNYEKIYIKDWSKDSYCSTESDLFSWQHPNYFFPPELKNLHNNTLLFTSAEMSHMNWWLVEWALEASEQIIN